MEFESIIDEETLRRYEEQGWGQTRIGFGERPALVIIDMQHDFVDPDSPSTCAPMAQERIPAIRSILDAARRVGVPVFHTRGIVKPDLSDLGLWKGHGKRSGRCQIDGSRGAEIVEDLAPIEGEHVVRKTRPSAFFGTDLHERLGSLGIDSLLVVGASMSGCVRATVTDGFSHDYRVSVIRDCVIDRSEWLVSRNLFDVAAKYADDIPLAEALSYLAETVVEV
jgi:nicotinamidase-related amidase